MSESLVRVRRFLVRAGSLATLGWECLRDYLRMLMHCKASPFASSQVRRDYDTVILAHTIEKGLSLPSPRPLFGTAKIEELIANFSAGEPCNSFASQMSLGALDAYLSYHHNSGIDNDWLQQLAAFLERSRAATACELNGGTRSAAGVFAKIAAREFDYSEFLLSRSSVRCFADKEIATPLVEGIVKVAQSAPSQCNRQATRVHYYSSQGQIAELLSLQGGTRGFTAQVHNLFVVTSDMAAWSGGRERNQSFVDASLFAMCLMLACQSHGIACCPLNLAVTNRREAAIRAVGGIPHGERAVMMIAFGWPAADHSTVARSPRLAVGDVLVHHVPE